MYILFFNVGQIALFFCDWRQDFDRNPVSKGICGLLQVDSTGTTPELALGVEVVGVVVSGENDRGQSAEQTNLVIGDARAKRRYGGVAKLPETGASHRRFNDRYE